MVLLLLPGLVACRSREHDRVAAEPPAPTKQAPPDGTRKYWAVSNLLATPIGISEIVEERTDEPRHFKITQRGGRVVSVEEVYPGGLVWSSTRYGDPGPNDVTTRDEFGQVDAVRHFDADNRTFETVLRSGRRDNRECYRQRIDLDSKGRVLVLACLDRQGRERGDRTGVARTKYEYDVNGALVSETYVELDDTPATSEFGVHRVENELDQLGRVTRRKHFDRDGHLVVNRWMGCAIQETEFDASGLPAAITCLDTGNRPVAGHDGIIRTRYSRDPHGCLTGFRYQDDGDRPAPLRDGTAELRMEPGPRCECLVATAVDLAGHQIGLREVATYDEQGLVTSRKLFDDRGRPARGGLCPAHEYRFEYDAQGRRTAETYFDTSGRPSTCQGVAGAYARQVSEYDARGNLTATTRMTGGAEPRQVERSETIFGSDDRAIEAHRTGEREHYAVYSYSSVGQLTEVAHLDARRKPIDIYFDYTAVADPWGWHRVTLVYDAAGRHTFDVYTRVNGREVRRVDCSVSGCW